MNRIGALVQKTGRGIGLLWRERPYFVNNPILLRELVTQLRNKQSFVYLFLFLAAASVICLLGWQTFLLNGYVDTSGMLARKLMLMLSGVEGLILLVFTPMLSATAVNQESERETWDLLLTSPINLSSIIIGKLLSSFVFTGFILLSIAPVISLTIPMGGVSPHEISLIFIALGEGIVVAALIGLYSSIRFKTTNQSITFTYIFCSIYFIGLPVIPTILTGEMGFWTLLSPSLLVFYVTDAQTMSILWGLLTLHEAIALHFLGILFVTAFLLFLSAWHLTPRFKERTEAWLRRAPIGVGSIAGNTFTLVGLFWFVALTAVAVTFEPENYMHFDRTTLLHLQRIAAALLLLLFPLASTIFYCKQWEKKPWDEVGSTPSILEKMLYRCILNPLSTYGRWTLGILFFFLVVFFNNPSTIQEGIWFFLFTTNAVLYIAVIGMASSLFTLNPFYAVVHCYSITIFIFFFMPLAVGSFFQPCVSPVYMAFAPFLDDIWSQPFSRILLGVENEWSYLELFAQLFLHVMISATFFIVVLLFCQKRLLKRAGFFERESFWHWVKRNFLNRKPKASSVPVDVVIPYFSDSGNPVTRRELREFFLYKRSKFVTSAIGLFVTSAILFWIVPVVSQIGPRFYWTIKTPLSIALLLSPFFIVPYAATLFRRERDQSTWDMLSTTTMTSEEIIQGKLLSGFYLFNIRYWAFLLPVAIVGFYFWEFGGGRYRNFWDYFLAFIGAGYPFILFVLSFSTYVSAKAQKTPIAYATALIAPYLFMSTPFIYPMRGSKAIESHDWFSPLQLFMDFRNQSTESWWANSLCFQIFMFFVLSGIFYMLTYSQLERRE